MIRYHLIETLHYFPGGQNWKVYATPNDNYAWSEKALEFFRDVQQTGDSNPGQFDVIAVSDWQFIDGVNSADTFNGSGTAINYYRTLGFAHASGTTGKLGVTPPAPWDADPDSALKMAPRGLGYLLYTGTVPDAKSYYCPSAGDIEYYLDVNYTDHKVYCTADPGFAAWYGGGVLQQNIKDWKSAGGFGKEDLLRGNWTRHNPNKGSRYDRYAILGQYNYRNTPLHPFAYSDVTSVDVVITIPYTKPAVKSHVNCPAFKTPKALKGRVIVTDSFDKPANKQSASDTTRGFGAYAHIDGYNILSGDYSTKWYSDQEKRMIYWDCYDSGDTMAGLTGSTGNGTDCGGLGIAGGMVMSRYVSAAKANTAMESALVWHTFDQAIGIDLDAAPNVPD